MVSSPPPQQTSIDLAAFLIERCQNLSGLFPGRMNFVQRFESNLRVPPATAHDVGEILNVSVENTVRHAHPAGLSALVALDCRRLSDDHISVDVSDDIADGRHIFHYFGDVRRIRNI